MCLLALAIGASERWPLVLASNRDEHRARATLPLTRWTSDQGTTVISGRDLLAGGTWLGCTPQGRVAMLTNVREATPLPARLSRGDLPLQWLNGQISATDFDEREGGAVMLNDKGRRTVITAWQEKKQEEVTHPLTEQKIPIGLLPFTQARFMARTIRGEMDGYLPFLSK